MNADQYRAIRRALLTIPERCRYHGDRLDRYPDQPWRLDACCETGEASLYRREALAALES